MNRTGLLLLFLLVLFAGCASRKTRFVPIEPLYIKKQDYAISVSPTPRGEYKFIYVRLEDIPRRKIVLDLSRSYYRNQNGKKVVLVELSKYLITKYEAYANDYSYNIAPKDHFVGTDIKNLGDGKHDLHLVFDVQGKTEEFDFSFAIGEKWVKWRDPSGK